MDRYFVDTNVFLRFLPNDVPTQADAAERVFQRAAHREIELETNVLVIAEIVWTLGSYYGHDRDAVKSAILAILNTPGLTVENADLVGEAVLLHASQNIDFVDAYSAQWMRRRRLTEAYTFDVRHFARVAGIARPEPGQ